MKSILRKIKGLLGFCQYNGCWKRHKYQIEIKQIKVKRCLCEKHTKDLAKNGELIGATLKDGREIRFSREEEV